MKEGTFARIVGLMVLAAMGLWLLSSGKEAAQNQSLGPLALAPQVAGTLPGGHASTSERDPAALFRGSASAVTVNLSEVPSGVPDPSAGLMVRPGFLEGGSETPLSTLEMTALRRAALDTPPSDGIASLIEGESGGITMVGGFDAMDITECCGGGGATVPPDPEIAVGPSRVIEVVNVALKVYSTGGAAVVGPVTFRSLFSGVQGCNSADDTSTIKSTLFDPNVLYDEYADRFVVAIARIRVDGSNGAVVGGSHYCVAVSASGDPGAGWHLYAFSMDNSDPGGVWMDYPQAGVGTDGIYMGGNLFTTSLSVYEESRVWVFDKAAMYTAQEASFLERSLGSDFTPQPMHRHGVVAVPDSAKQHYVLAQRDVSGGGVHAIYRWTDALAGGALSMVGLVDLNAASGVPAQMPQPSPQLGGDPIAGNDWRPLDFEYRGGFGLTASTVSCNPGSGSVNCVRWALLDLEQASVAAAAVFGTNGSYRSFPDVALNACQQPAMGYTRSSESEYPGTFIGIPAGGSVQEHTLKPGEVLYTAFDNPNNSELPGRRWGDYTGMTIAPDQRTFWYVGQYSKDTGSNQGRWGTYIGAFQRDDCSTLEGLDHQIYVPSVSGVPLAVLTKPKAGHWEATSNDFYVVDGGDNVDRFSVYIHIDDSPDLPPGCPGDYRITQPAKAAILNDQFSYDGAFKVNGTFNTPFDAQGTDELVNLYIPACEASVKGGPWNWQAAWDDESSPPPLGHEGALALPRTVTLTTSEQAIGAESIQIFRVER